MALVSHIILISGISINFWLIRSSKQDPRLRSGLKITHKGSVGSDKIKVNIMTLVLFLFLFVSCTAPFIAHAGFFSFVSSLFSSNQAVANDVFPNSQNMALLQASISPTTELSSTTKSNFSIVSDTSIVPESTGLPADSVDHSINQDQISLYVVHKGDTLPEIAKMFKVTVNTIRWANDLTGNTITVGQTLVILPISGIEHTVKSGDTLQSIAKLHKGDLEEIMQYNNLTKESKLAIGDVVIVPDGEAMVTPVSSKAKNNTGVGTKGASTPTYVGYYMRPLIGGVKTQGIHGHNGVDLASYEGSDILAAAEGDVIISRNSGWNGGYGSYIVLKHGNGTQTLYGHLSTTLVSVGDHVEQGQIIGKMGHTGQVVGRPGTHLHFEIRGAVNPF